MKQRIKDLAAICGLYCGTCPHYLAPRINDHEQLEQISQDKRIPVEGIGCDGCLSERVSPHCMECRHGFRRCAAEKNVTWCFECPEFPCQRLRDFRNTHIVDGISHHEHVIEELQYIKEHGIERWVDKQASAGQCPQCGKELYWFTRQCPSCHTQIREAH